MARKPRNSRAARRNALRRAKNQATRQASAAQAEPKPERARHVPQLIVLLGRGSISEAQYEAGDRLYRDWRVSGSEPAMVAGYERTIPGSRDMTERQALARARVTAALRSVGPIGSDVLVHVCLIDGSLPTWEQVAGRRPGDGAAILRAALDRLAEWYAKHRQQKANSSCALTAERELG